MKVYEVFLHECACLCVSKDIHDTLTFLESELENCEVGTKVTIAIKEMSFLSLPILNICRTIRETFPTLRFEWKNSQDKGVNFLIHDIGVYLSSEFEEFLETVANSLTDEEFMCIDFLPVEKE